MCVCVSLWERKKDQVKRGSFFLRFFSSSSFAQFGARKKTGSFTQYFELFFSSWDFFFLSSRRERELSHQKNERENFRREICWDLKQCLLKGWWWWWRVMMILERVTDWRIYVYLSNGHLMKLHSQRSICLSVCLSTSMLRTYSNYSNFMCVMMESREEDDPHRFSFWLGSCGFYLLWLNGPQNWTH